MEPPAANASTLLPMRQAHGGGGRERVSVAPNGLVPMERMFFCRIGLFSFDGTLLPQSRAAPLGLRLRRSLPRLSPEAWFRFDGSCLPGKPCHPFRVPHARDLRAAFVLACSRKARPSGPPSVATTRPSQGHVSAAWFRFDATCLPASGGALRVTHARDLPRLSPEAWFSLPSFRLSAFKFPLSSFRLHPSPKACSS
jgi:hypothetical protein